MHASCWDILVQQYALHATRDPLHPNLSRLGTLFSAQNLKKGYRGLIPSWAGDYNGPERFWSDGWSDYHPVPEASDVAGLLEVAPEYDFLVHDPGNAQGFDELLEDPPLAHSHPIPSTNISWKADHHDPFSCLPTELLIEVLCLLPTTAAQAVRLASRAMASVTLSSEFWRSRFDFPNELCHIRLPQRFASGPRADSMAVDWRRFCFQLLHLNDKCWQNRKRIMDLNGKLVKMILAQDNTVIENF